MHYGRYANHNEGGGVKGLAYVGAYEVLQNHYNFIWFAGTSAGAIAASLFAAGLTTEEVETELRKKNFKEFLDGNFLSGLSNILLKGKKGLFSGDEFKNWITELIAKKLELPYPPNFEDLPHRLSILASRNRKDGYVFDSIKSSSKVDVGFAVRFIH